MSLGGCNFTCKNKECKYVNTGFTLTGSWPLGLIDTVIENTDDEGLRHELIKKKEHGYKYSKITYPDPYYTPIEAYSIEKFCTKCNRIHLFDEKDAQDICSICGEKYLDFHESISEGIPCPSCGEALEQTRWYVQIKEDEDDDSESSI